MIYDKYCELCASKGVAPTTAALEAGISKSTITKWKNNPETTVTSNILNKLSSYFGMTPYDLMAILDGDKEVPEVEYGELGRLSDQEIKAVLMLRRMNESAANSAVDALEALAKATETL